MQHDLARITKLTERVFDDKAKAAAWLETPLAVFSGKTPVEMLETSAGAEEVEQTLGRIEHGIFG